MHRKPGGGLPNCPLVNSYVDTYLYGIWNNFLISCLAARVTFEDWGGIKFGFQSTKFQPEGKRLIAMFRCYGHLSCCFLPFLRWGGEPSTYPSFNFGMPNLRFASQSLNYSHIRRNIHSAGWERSEKVWSIGNHSSTAFYLLFFCLKEIWDHDSSGCFSILQLFFYPVISRNLQEQLSKHVYKYLQLSGSSSGLASKTIMVGGGYRGIYTPLNFFTFQKKKVGGSPW